MKVTFVLLYFISLVLLKLGQSHLCVSFTFGLRYLFSVPGLYFSFSLLV